MNALLKVNHMTIWVDKLQNKIKNQFLHPPPPPPVENKVNIIEIIALILLLADCIYPYH